MYQTHKNDNESTENDFYLLDIAIDTLAKLKITELSKNDSGKTVLTPQLSPSNRQPYLKKTNVIIAPDGTVVYPQSLYTEST